MITRTILASLTASLVALASPALGQIPPPDGMTWKTDTGDCRSAGGDIEGCAFGPAGANGPTGHAYYRACGTLVEGRPFLIVDMVQHTFRFDARDRRPVRVVPFRNGATSYTLHDVIGFAGMIETKLSCRSA